MTFVQKNFKISTNYIITKSGTRKNGLLIVQNVPKVLEMKENGSGMKIIAKKKIANVKKQVWSAIYVIPNSCLKLIC